jgi:N-methylhydantoinase A
MTDDGEDVPSTLRRVFGELERRAACELKDSGASVAGLRFAYTIDVRYVGQNFELNVPVHLEGTDMRELIRARFHEEHRKVYGFVRENSTLELVTFRLRATIPTPRPPIAQELMPRRPGEPSGSRMVVFDEAADRLCCALYQRASLAADQTIGGPAIIEQMDTTTIVPPGFCASAHPSGNLFLARDQRSVS